MYSPPLTARNDGTCFTAEAGSAFTGITFHLPSYRRFIPYSWLEHVEMDCNEKELRFTYTHTVVLVKGERLGEVQAAAEKFELRSVREHSCALGVEEARPHVSRIEIAENAN